MTEHTRTTLAKAFAFSAMLAQSALAACDFRKILKNSGFQFNDTETVNTGTLPFMDGRPVIVSGNGHIKKATNDKNLGSPALTGSGTRIIELPAFDGCNIYRLELDWRYGSFWEGAFFETQVYKNSTFKESKISKQRIIGGEITSTEVVSSRVNDLEELGIITLKDTIDEFLKKLFPFDHTQKINKLDKELYQEVLELFPIIDESVMKTHIQDSSITDSVIFGAIISGKKNVLNDTLIYESSQKENSIITDQDGRVITLKENNKRGFPQNPPPTTAIDYAMKHKNIKYQLKFSKNIGEELINRILFTLKSNFAKFGIIFAKYHPNTADNSYGTLEINKEKIDKNLLARAGSIALFPLKGSITLNELFNEDLFSASAIHEVCHQIFGARHIFGSNKFTRGIDNIQSGYANFLLGDLLVKRDPGNLSPETIKYMEKLAKALGINPPHDHKHFYPILNKDKIHHGNEFTIVTTQHDLDSNIEIHGKIVRLKKVEYKPIICADKDNCGKVPKVPKEIYRLFTAFKEFLIIPYPGKELTLSIRDPQYNSLAQVQLDINPKVPPPPGPEVPLRTPETTPPPGNNILHIGLSIFAGIVLLASAALAGTYYYKRKQRNQREGQDGTGMVTRPGAPGTGAASLSGAAGTGAEIQPVAPAPGAGTGASSRSASSEAGTTSRPASSGAAARGAASLSGAAGTRPASSRSASPRPASPGAAGTRPASPGASPRPASPGAAARGAAGTRPEAMEIESTTTQSWEQRIGEKPAPAGLGFFNA